MIHKHNTAHAQPSTSTTSFLFPTSENTNSYMRRSHGQTYLMNLIIQLVQIINIKDFLFRGRVKRKRSLVRVARQKKGKNPALGT